MSKVDTGAAAAAEPGAESVSGAADRPGMNALHIGFLYVGSLMGAGFASGKESWQFFGVFGIEGIMGVFLATFILVSFGYMTVTIADKLRTGDMCKLIFPTDSKNSELMVGIVMQVFLFMAHFSMLAAGGALLSDQFGIHHVLGSLGLMIVVVLTTLKGFHAVSGGLQKVTPLLVGGALLLSVLVIVKSGGQIELHPKEAASPLASNWLMAAIALVSYNMTAGIPILGNCMMHCGSLKSARRGAVLGGLMLGTCTLILYFSTLTDPAMASASSLPMLSLCAKIAPWVQKIYALVLLIAIFGTATSTLYGISTKLPQTRHKSRYICGLAALGFGMSLFGFSNLVAFMYPIGGYAGLIFLVFLVINFVRVQTGKRVLKIEDREMG